MAQGKKTTDISEQIASALLKISAVRFDFSEQIMLNSGVMSPIYIDNRLIISYPEVRDLIVEGFLLTIAEYLSDDTIDIISGTASAAIPFAALIAQRKHKGMVYVRSKEKGHGKENKVEGVIKKGQRVLVIEDHISSGGSAINNATTLRSAGAKVEHCFAITSYGLKSAENLFKKHKIALHTLTTFPTIIEVAKAEKYIDTKKRKKLLDWWKDPVTWGFT